jgi:hypothetical protein
MEGRMSRFPALLFFGLVALLMPALVPAETMATEQRAPGAADTEQYPVLPKPGAKVPLGEGHYFTYGFDRPPKLGTVILKVQVFSAAGQQDALFDVQADADMPKMRGAHATGFQEFKVSKKRDYLLPVTLVMPGEWEIRLRFLRDGRPVFRGSHVLSF